MSEKEKLLQQITRMILVLNVENKNNASIIASIYEMENLRL